MKTVIQVVIVAFFVYWGIASIVWEFRNPLANRATAFTEFLHVLRFERHPAYQRP